MAQQTGSISFEAVGGFSSYASGQFTTTEDVAQMAQPNLTPWFSVSVDDTSYWAELHCRNTSVSNSEGLHGIWDGEDGWAHITLDSRTSAGNDGSKTCYMNMHVAHPKIADKVTAGGKYTWLIEVRNLTWIAGASGNALNVRPSVNNATLDVFNTCAKAFTEDGAQWGVVTAKSDLSVLTTKDTRGYCYIPTGCYADFDLRVSLYEGEYEGPYKPYVDQSLITRVSTAETSIEQNAEAITLRATKTELAKETRQRKGTYAECTTDTTTINKVATISPAVSDFELYPGVTVTVCFTKGNNVASPKLNVNGTGLYPIVVNATTAPALAAVKWGTYVTAMFTFDTRNQWRLVSVDEDVRRLTNAETKIEQNAEAITLRATKEEFNNLTIGGRNLVWDTEWNDIPNRWNVWGSPTTREIVTINGKRWLHLVTTTATFQGYQQNPARREKTDPVNEIAPGDTLTVSFTAYAASAARWGVIGFHLTNASSIVKQEWLNFDVTTIPQRFWASFTVPDNTDIDRFNIMIGDNSTQAHEVWISEVKLEKGNRATDWTPAPEDMATNVALSAELKVASDSITSTVRKKFARNNIDQFFFNTPFRTSTDYDGGYWQPTSDNWLMKWATPLEEGWAHLSVSAGKQIELAIPRIESLKAGDQATLLFEWRNVTVEGNPNIYARNYPQNCQFSLNSYQCAWSTSTPTSGSKAVSMVCNSTATGTAAWNAAINLAMTNTTASGKSFEGDLRLSISTDVSRSDIISSINQSAETIKISADKVNIEGAAIFTGTGRLSSTSLNNAYDAKGAAATVQENLDNLQVGGRNLLLWTETLKKGSDLSVNGKDGIAGWSTNTLLVETTDGIRLNAANISSECFGIPLANNGSVGNNEKVLLTFEARGNVTSVGQFYWLQASGGNIAFNNWLNGSGSISLSETEWRKFTADVTHAQANVRTCTRILFFYNLGSANNGKWIELRKGSVKLEKGDKATDWSPAPEDQTAYVDNSVNSIQVGGRNLLRNTANFSGWARGNVNITGGQADPDGGNNAFLLTPTSGTDHYIRHGGNGHVPQLGEYTISVWLKASAAHTIYVTLENSPSYRINAALTTEWQKFTMVVDITSLSTVDYNFFVIGGYGSWPSTTPNVYVYHPKVEKGNRATEWTPAPEDITSRTQRIYYRSDSATKPATPSAWVIKEDDGTGAWTKMHVAITSTHKYIYTCEQSEKADGTLDYTAVLRDNTITVIDGGNVITHSIDANRLTVYDANIGKIKADAIDVSAIKIGELDGASTVVSNAANGKSAYDRHTAYRGTCSTAAGTAAKVVTCTGFALATGATVEVYCSTANTADVPTLNVNSTGAKPIWINGAVASASNPCKWLAGDTVTFTYDGTRFRASLPVEGYVTEGTGGGLMVHRKSDATTGVKITDSVDVMRDGVSVAEYGDTARIGKSDSGHIEISSNSLTVYVDDAQNNLVKAATIKTTLTQSGLLNAFYFVDDNDNHDFAYVYGTKFQTKTVAGVYAESTEEALVSLDAYNSHGSLASIGLTATEQDSEITLTADSINLNGSLTLSTPLADSNLPTKDSAGTAGTADATSGATLAVPYITTDAYGRVTAKGTHTHTIGSLAASAVTSGEFDAARIPNLDASKINSGTFDAARIPSLNASKINAGTFNAARIPNLNASKINAGTIDSARLPTVPVDKGGTGQTGVTTITTVASFIAAASGVTVSSVRVTVWGKLVHAYVVAKPSAAQSAAWVVGTVVDAYKPNAVVTGKPYYTGVDSARIQTNGQMQITACGAHEVGVSFTYLLA